MPKVEKLKNLYKLTDNITQTVAHDRYATQEICNKYKIPTHLFSALWDMSAYKKRDFSQKEKIIVLSPDANNSDMFFLISSDAFVILEVLTPANSEICKEISAITSD